MQPSLIEKVARSALLVLIASMPFLFVPVASVSLQMAKVALAAACIFIAVLCSLIALVRDRGIRVPASSMLIAIGSLAFVYLLSAVFSGWSDVSLFGSGVDQDTVASVILFVSAFSVSALFFAFDGRRAVYALRAVFVGVLVLFVFQAVHLLLPSFPLSSLFATSAGNALGGWHEFGILAGLSAILSISLAYTRVGSGLWKYVLFACALLALFFLIIGNFFDVWIGVLIAAAATLAVSYLRSRADASSTRGSLLLIALIVISGPFIVWGSVIYGKLPSSLQVNVVESRPSLRGTLTIGKEAWTGPTTLLFGSGPNTFRHTWGLYKPQEINQTIFWNENFTAGYGLVPTSLVTTGLLGVLAWLGIMATLVWSTFRSFARAPSLEAGAIARSLGIGTLYLFAFLALYVPGPALAFLTFLFGGLFCAFLYHAQLIGMREWRFSGGIAQKLGATALIGCAAISLIASLGVLRVLASEVAINTAIVHYNATEDINGASSRIQQALAIYPSSDRAHLTAVELGLVQLRQLAAASSTDEVRAKLQSSLEGTIRHGLDAVRINGDYQNWLRLAALYQDLAGVKIEGAEEQARDAYQKALKENPANPLPYLYLAQLELLQNKGDAALADLAEAIRLKPDFAPAYYLASQIYAAAGDFKSAQAVATKAVEYAQDDKLAWYNLGAIAYANKDYEVAAAAEQETLTRDPQYADALFIFGLSLYELQRVDDAIKVFESLAQLDPNAETVRSVLENLKSGKPPISQQESEGPTE